MKTSEPLSAGVCASCGQSLGGSNSERRGHACATDRAGEHEARLAEWDDETEAVSLEDVELIDDVERIVANKASAPAVDEPEWLDEADVLSSPPARLPRPSRPVSIGPRVSIGAAVAQAPLAVKTPRARSGPAIPPPRMRADERVDEDVLQLSAGLFSTAKVTPLAPNPVAPDAAFVRPGASGSDSLAPVAAKAETGEDTFGGRARTLSAKGASRGRPSLYIGAIALSFLGGVVFAKMQGGSPSETKHRSEGMEESTRVGGPSTIEVNPTEQHRADQNSTELAREPPAIAEERKLGQNPKSQTLPRNVEAFPAKALGGSALGFAERATATAGPEPTPEAVNQAAPTNPASAPPAQVGTDTESPEAKAQPGAEFNTNAAAASLVRISSEASACRSGGPSGIARVAVTFAPSGRVTSARINGPPYAGTPAGGCIARLFRGATVPPFEGPPVTVHQTVTIR